VLAPGCIDRAYPLPVCRVWAANSQHPAPSPVEGCKGFLFINRNYEKHSMHKSMGINSPDLF